MNYPHHDAIAGTRLEKGLWLKAVPVISTAHVTREDGELLAEVARTPWPIIDRHSDGSACLLRVPEDNDCQSVNCDFSHPFTCLLEEFRKLGYRWIILDRDGDKIPGLPTFDW